MFVEKLPNPGQKGGMVSTTCPHSKNKKSAKSAKDAYTYSYTNKELPMVVLNAAY